MPHLSELLNDPSWFPGVLNTKAGTLCFNRIDRDSLSREAFLDQRMAGSVTARETASLSDVIAAVSSEVKPTPAFIFHSAFCCSTLLAKALDLPGTAISLKEPEVLMGLANAHRVDKQVRQSSIRAKALVHTIFILLARQFTPTERVLIKPTNSANNLLPDAIATGAQVLLLYGDLRSFLVSVLKKGEACKSFVRQQYNIFALDAKGLAGIPARQAISFTNLQAVARHLGLPHNAATLDLTVQGSVFQTNAKFADQAYDVNQRYRDVQTIEMRYGETLDMIETWAKQVNLGTNIQMPLPGAIST